MGYNPWLDSMLKVNKTNLRDYITGICHVIESDEFWTHHMQPWFSNPAFDRIERHCICGYTQMITGQQLSFADSVDKMAKLIHSLYIGAGGCPVTPVDWAAPPKKSISTKKLAEKQLAQLLGAGMISPDAAMDMLKSFDPQPIQPAPKPQPVATTPTPHPYAPVDVPDINDEILGIIVGWLEQPAASFDSWNNWRYREIPVFTHLTLAHPMVEGELSGPIETSHPDFYKLVIKRELIHLTDDRWWVEIAIRVDTGEPVASVNHQGSLKLYLEEMHS